MSLAKRIGLHQYTGYVPIVFVVTAFALGVQAALFWQAFSGLGYPPPGRGLLTWSTLAVLLASIVLHVPYEKPLSLIRRARHPVTGFLRRRAVILEPHPDAQSPEHALEAPQDHEPSQRLSVRVHSPLAAGPVVAPQETLPITVEAEPEPLAQELSVAFELHGPSTSRTVHRQMNGERLVEGFEFKQPGGFEIHVRLDHPDADPVGETLSGRVATYQEETARLFEALKERLSKAGLDVGPQSTPREICEALGTIDAADPATLAELAVELEIALYGDEAVERSTYENIHLSLEELNLSTVEEDSS